MSYENIMKELSEIKENPAIVEETYDRLDSLLNSIIKVEKKHLYGLETTSEAKRQEEIKKLIDAYLLEMEAEGEP